MFSFASALLLLTLQVPDVEVIDQHGRRLHFYRDLVQGKAVVVNTIYTSCNSTCPLLSRAFTDLQTALGPRLGRDVFLISVSRDPEHDTPTRLRAWGRRFHARPGWILVTGRKESIDAILLALTGDPARTGGHSEAILIGDDVRGIWHREWGLAEPERVIRKLDEREGEGSEP